MERRACIRFEGAREGGSGGGISTDGVLIAAPSAVERASWRETGAKEKERKREMGKGREISDERKLVGGRRAKRKTDQRVRQRHCWTVNDCRLKCPLRLGPPAGPTARLTNGSRNLHSLRGIANFSREPCRGHLFAACSTVEEIKPKRGKGVEKGNKECPLRLFICRS